ncbi:MAG: hypothetical protein K9K67_00425 [Bacteriovoracaceae bacterium]|nr:hypothetical protein [Bacteriovoracaceae bacterium]
MMKYLLFFTFIFVSCSHVSEKSVVVGESLKAHHFKDIYFSGQPSMEDFKKLKEQGFTHIVNLRRETEYNELEERGKIKELGMIYSHHPFPLDMKIDDAYVDGVTGSIVENRKKGKTLVHCSSGNRVGIWVGAHFSKDHSQTPAKAFETAEENGLDKESAKKALRNYLKLPTN